MPTFIFAFLFMLVVMFCMALGVMLMGKRIKGSCGGLNAVAGADRCLVCKKEIDPDSPLRDRLHCPRARQMVERMAVDQEA
ncbi:MAG: (Na+)-NQR maturation NqrM [Pseudomonadota bacterium]